MHDNIVNIVKKVGFLAAAVAVPAGLLTGCSSAKPSSAPSTRAAAATSASASASAVEDSAAFTGLESKYHAQLGVYAVDTGTGRTVAFQADERFAFCSTIKAFAASALLQHDDAAQLNQTITYASSDLVDYSPVTSLHVKDGMTLKAIMAAAIEVSDNTAYNLMLKQLGGPAALQAVLRAMGDATTNVDRTEPTVNSAVPGDPRDTSTPRAMAADLRAFVLGTALPASARAQLTAWLQANTTGGPYIRASVPPGWKVGDKTGNGDYGTRNDMAVIWPSTGAAPIVLVVLTHRSTQNATSDDALIADATKIALQELN